MRGDSEYSTLLRPIYSGYVFFASVELLKLLKTTNKRQHAKMGIDFQTGIQPAGLEPIQERRVCHVPHNPLLMDKLVRTRQEGILRQLH